MTHQGNACVVSIPSKASDLLQKGAHAVFSSRALQKLLIQLLYLPVAENLLLFQQECCKCIHFLHGLMIEVHIFLGELQCTFVSNWFTFCNTTKPATGPRLKDAETSWVQGKQVTMQRCPEDWVSTRLSTWPGDTAFFIRFQNNRDNRNPAGFYIGQQLDKRHKYYTGQNPMYHLLWQT